MFDPYASLDPYARLSAPQRQPSQIQPLAPQEEESVLSRIGGAALGGVGYAGSVLEKALGGRAVRGLLGGKPRELLSLLPFSDTLGITDEGDRVSGKELLGFDKHDDSWTGMLGGLATELATDPGSYLSFGAGAVSKAGQVAKAAGVLPKTVGARATTTLADILKATPTAQGALEAAAGGAQQLQPLLSHSLGGVAGLGLPFQHPSMLLGTGQAGADFMSGLGTAASTVDAAARAVPVLGSAYNKVGQGLDAVGRYGKAWFDPTVMGATTHAGQEAAQEASAAIKPAIVAARNKTIGYGDELQPLLNSGRGADLRQMLEGNFTGPVQQPLQSVVGRMKGDVAAELKQLQDLGLDIPAWADPHGAADYFPRQMAPLAKPTSGLGAPQQPLKAVDPRVLGREEILGGIQGGTEGINQLVTDAGVHTGTRLDGAAYIRNAYLGGRTDAEAMKQSERLSDWARGLDQQYRAAGQQGQDLAFFGHHPLADYQTYMERTARLKGAAEAGHGLLARSVQDAANLPGGVRVADALKAAGLGLDVAVPGGSNTGGMATLLSRTNQLRAAAGQPALASGDLAQMAVDPSVVKELTRYMGGFKAPEAVSAPLRVADQLTNLTKAGQTALWPAFHVRNLVSGLVQNLGLGGADAVATAPAAYRMLRGEAIPWANQVPGLTRLSAEEATRVLGKEMYAHGIGQGGASATREIVGPAGGTISSGQTLENILGRIPGEQPQSVMGSLSALGSKEAGAWNPLNTAGVGSNKDIFAPLVAGRQVGDVVEGVNRNSLYLSLRKQGYTPEMAAEQVLKGHFDYGPTGSTQVEKGLLKRIFPFYTYSRHNIPSQIEQMATHPGGVAGMTTRAAGSLRQNGGEQFLPDYLGSGLALPMGGEDNGTQRFLTRMDLPAEQAFESLKGGVKGPGNTLMGLLGQVNPLIKAPIEWGTGKQFFTGRDLEDLYSQTGSPALDQLIMNSPISRLATTARTIADPRKWENPVALPLNLGTGLKVSDVDMGKQRSIAEREYVQEMLRGLPAISKFETLSVKPELAGTLTPEEFILARLNKTLEARARAQSQQAKGGGQ